MSDEVKEVLASAAEPWQKGIKLVDRLFDAAQPSVVYGEPIACDGKTVITASEVSVAMGFGYGSGAGSGGGVPEEGLPATGDGGSKDLGAGGGGGGGGGGASSARPVAVITVGHDGVQVQPVIDITKIALAFATAIGSMLFMLRKMRHTAGG